MSYARDMQRARMMKIGSLDLRTKHWSENLKDENALENLNVGGKKKN